MASVHVRETQGILGEIIYNYTSEAAEIAVLLRSLIQVLIADVAEGPRPAELRFKDHFL